jgi:ABC-type sugar transport system ATPase subunit
MPEISLNNINNFALKNFNLQIRDGEFIVVAGSNGAGKTTLINVIAGLVSYTGSVQFNGQSIDSMPPSKRNVGYVFQNLVLFPHMDAFSNIAFGLKAKKFNDDEIKTRTGEMLKFMEIEHLAFRHPSEMSGGEKQRVALARALAPKPDVLLLDEPTSNLDIKTARHLKNELKQIQRRTQITTIYVTILCQMRWDGGQNLHTGKRHAGPGRRT